MKSLFFIAAAFVSLLGSAVFAAGPDRMATSDSVYIDSGNKFRVREVKPSTHAAVVISSAATDSGLGIETWRRRFVTNGSTRAVLGLYPSDTTNTTYNYADGITLSSTTTTEVIVTVGNTVEINHQAAIKGIWKVHNGTGTVADTAGGRGAIVREEYWK